MAVNLGEQVAVGSSSKCFTKMLCMAIDIQHSYNGYILISYSEWVTSFSPIIPPMQDALWSLRSGPTSSTCGPRMCAGRGVGRNKLQSSSPWRMTKWMTVSEDGGIAVFLAVSS